MIRRILVGLGDCRYATAATQMAIDLARNHEAELTGVSILDRHRIAATGPVPIGAGHIAQELRQHRMTQVREIIEDVDDQFAEACDQAALSYRVECNEGEPYQCMIDLARYHDLVVCGCRHLFEHGVVDEPPAEFARLVNAGVRPLITVGDEFHPIRRVLIAYSGSIESAKAMKRFLQLRPWPNVSMRIVAYPHRPIADRLLADALGYCRAHDGEVDTDDLDGQDLLAYADAWSADMIVLGNSGRNLLLRRIFRDSTLQTLDRADRPLFLAQ